MKRLPYDGFPKKWWEKLLTFLTKLFVNLIMMSTLILAAVFIFLSIYFMYTEDLIKFACSVILILTFVYVNKS